MYLTFIFIKSIQSILSVFLCHSELLTLPKTVQIAEAVWTQRHSTGGLALEIRRAGIRRGQTLDHHHLVRLGILEPNKLDVVLLGHYMRYLHADIVSSYGDLGQMLGRISVAVWLIDFLVELALLRGEIVCTYIWNSRNIRVFDHMRASKCRKHGNHCQHFTWLATHNIIRRLNRLDLRIQRGLIRLGVSRSCHHTGDSNTKRGGYG